jgi:hypothetical protein
MKPRSLAAFGLLLLLAAGVQALAQDPSPEKLGAASVAPTTPPDAPRQVLRPDGTPDTTHYLPDDAILGRIDGRVFRVFEFRDRWFASYLLDRPKNDSAGRYEFLNAMVNKEVLAALARAAARPLGFEDRAALRETRQRLLSNATFARLIADSVRYTNDEVRHLYEQGSHQLRLQRIVAAGPEAAEQARADVVGKRLSWADAVRRYSKGGTGPDGDLGWVKRQNLGAEAALEIFDLPDGGVSKVYHDADGWWFVRVAERRPDQQPLFRFAAKTLAQQVLGAKLAQRTEQLRAQVRQRIGMTYDSTNIAWAAAWFAKTEAQAQGSPADPVIDLTGNVPEFQPADTSRILARWKDGRFSLGGFLGVYNATTPMQRSKAGSFDAFRSALDLMVLEPYMAELALERGLDRDSIVLAGMAKKEEQLRVEHLFGDSIEARLWVSNEERHKYYQDHLPDFFGLQSVTYAAHARHSKAGVDSLLARLQAGERDADILRADSLAGIVLGSIRTEGERDGSEYHKLLFEEMREGDVQALGPDKLGDYLVLHKLVHDPGHQLPFEQVETLVDESVQNLKAERMLKEFIERHRASHDVELHPERLPLIRLVDPADD